MTTPGACAGDDEQTADNGQRWPGSAGGDGIHQVRRRAACSQWGYVNEHGLWLRLFPLIQPEEVITVRESSEGSRLS
ncbi:hypothetical protein JHK85_029696 [Glycine max]|nr:hypothetical protein JHK85_029696 [Glycine max]KAH1139795.1 hypothetical protein GYH30_028926 [Glycine max]